ncbi:hypothetical protein L0F63_002638 [Massospora cicadina]|nr:hypothetical protein L0F63_002638 [Massospora cicadina]
MATTIPFNTLGADDQARFFNPALWRQRREHIVTILKQINATSVIDYGCGEGSVISFLITCQDEPPITKLAGLDISSEALSQCKERCQPWPSDFQNLRERPIRVELFQGSVDKPFRPLQGYDVLVSSEVVEHLYPETLEGYSKVMFGVYRPRVVILSTPNAEFNVLFPQLKYLAANAKFRDDDHKFEWTRAEFQAWCQVNCERYGYDVAYSGVGVAPDAKDRHLGFCTQFALFTRKGGEGDRVEVEFEPHQLMATYDFPWFDKEVTDLERAACILDYSRYMDPAFYSLAGGWPVFRVGDFWAILKVRQYNRRLENLLAFLASPSRNGGKFSLHDDSHFVIHHPIKKPEAGYGSNWP